MTQTKAPTLAELMQQRDALVGRGDFLTLGQLAVVHVIQGKNLAEMDFRKAGPMIGLLGDGSLVVLSEWMGLPDIPQTGNEPCPDCLAPCDECKGGKRGCTAYGCGGAGKIRRTIPCPACVKFGRNNPKCKTCRGAGELVEYDPCTVCQGTGLMDCPLCHGTGKMNTGTASRRVEKSGRDPKTGQPYKPEPVCKTCNGTKRKFKSLAQSLQQFAFGQVEGFPCFGPISRIYLHGQRGDHGCSIIDVRPDANGNYMVLMLDRLGGRRAYLFGGVPSGEKIVQQAMA